MIAYLKASSSYLKAIGIIVLLLGGYFGLLPLAG